MQIFRILVLGIGLCVSGFAAALLPGTVGQWKQTSAEAFDVPTDKPLWNELGLNAAERGEYALGDKTLKATAWRLADATSGQGAFLYLLPGDAKPLPVYDKLTPNSAAVATGALVNLGNIVLRLDGALPDPDSVANMFRSMPHFENGALPIFASYLPSNGRVPNTTRYLGGPEALSRFVPGLNPSVVAFRMGAEGMVAEYPAGVKLALFSYPTPAIARQRESELTAISKAFVKRTGPLVAVVFDPKDTAAAERALALVKYQATVTFGERLATKKDNPGNLLLNIAILILVIGGFCLVSGVLFGLLRYALRRGGASGDGDEMITLHISGQ